MLLVSPRRRRAALIALALGGFGLGLTEFVVMGLLPEISRDLLPTLHQQHPSAAVARTGWLITAYAAGVVVGAPTFAALSARLPRRRLVLGLLALLALGTVASALAPTFPLAVGARFVAGLPHGAYFGAAATVAAALLGPGSQAKGFAVVIGGLTVANVGGVPLITALGQATSWRVAYLVVAGAFLVTMAAVALTVPELAAPAEASFRTELRALRNPTLWVMAGISAVGFAGFFALYSYIAPVTTQVAGLPASAIPWVLVAAGAGMTLGNALGGHAADRHLNRSLVGGFTAVVATLGLLALTEHTAVGLFGGVFLVCAASLFTSPGMQLRLQRAAPDAHLMAPAVNQSATNLANSAGAALGGAVISAGLGFRAPTVLAMLLAATGLLFTVLTVALPRRRTRQSESAPCVDAERNSVYV